MLAEFPAQDPATRKPASYRDLSATLHRIGMPPNVLAAFEIGGKSRLQAERIERQRAIIIRCDAGSELHKVVAAELGISMRTFYREREVAFRRVRRVLEKASHAALERSPIAEPEPAVEHAWHSGWLGREREAAAALEAIARSASPALLAVTAARLAAMRFLAGGQGQDSVDLSRARRALAALGPGAASGVAEAEIALVEAMLCRARGEFAAANRLHERIVRVLEQLPGNAFATAEIATLERVETQLAAGNARRALEAGIRARDVQSATSGAAWVLPALRVAIAESTVIVGGDCAAALEQALDAHAWAAANGATILAAQAQRVAAQTTAAMGDAVASRTHLRAALECARNMKPNRRVVVFMLDLAGAFADAGDGDTALALVERCAQDRRPGTFGDGIACLRAAEGCVAVGRLGEALRHANQAVGILSCRDSRRALGEAELVLGRAALSCGEARIARAAAARASQLLRGATWPPKVAQAERLAGRRASAAIAPARYTDALAG